jgi:hypothetical protein
VRGGGCTSTRATRVEAVCPHTSALHRERRTETRDSGAAKFWSSGRPGGVEVLWTSCKGANQQRKASAGREVLSITVRHALTRVLDRTANTRRLRRSPSRERSAFSECCVKIGKSPQLHYLSPQHQSRVTDSQYRVTDSRSG